MSRELEKTCCWTPGNRVPKKALRDLPETAYEPGGISAKQLNVKIQKTTRE
jgi:hypothetical protein